MKLYTEEQVRGMMQDIFNFGDLAINYAVSRITYIELPSDEAIDKGASDVFLLGAEQGKFISGARWVIEQIKKQENGKNNKISN